LEPKRLIRVTSLLLGVFASAIILLPTNAVDARRVPAPVATPIASVMQVQTIPVERAASVLRSLYPSARIRVDAHANAVIVVASPDDIQAMRTVLQGIDVRNPTQPSVQVVQLKVLKPDAVVGHLRGLFPTASVTTASRSSLLVRASPLDMSQITALISALDTTNATPAPTTAPVQAFPVRTALPRTVARAVVRELPGVRVNVSGSNLLVSGDPDQVAKAKDLIASLDAPGYGARYTTIIHVKNIDASSVADLVTRSYPSAHVTLDRELNAISVQAIAADQQRIADAVAQLDGSGAASQATGAAYGGGNVDVVYLKAAMPGTNGSQSTSAQDIAQAVSSLLQPLAPDLHMTTVANSSKILLAGSPSSIRLAEDLIRRLDVVPPLVVLDTEVFEVDENSASDLGLQFPTGGALLSTSFSEVLPPYDPNTGQPGRIARLQPLTRTPLQLQFVLNLLVQKGNARVLADPRVATLSGHTASIRAGDQLSILTQSGGGVGTPVTQQLQTFNTGVTLDITPMVSDDDGVIVDLHPVVNSLEGLSSAGVPQISTRDTQTLVHLKNDQTLVIGGLIQDTYQKQTSTIPILGQLPLIGRIFRSDSINSTRNELVIMVTPHILKDGGLTPSPGLAVPTPGVLPTLPTDGARTPAPRPTPYHGPIYATPSPTVTDMPQPTPSAFSNANVFEYGSAPSNTYAAPADAPQIFYARISPTVVKAATQVTVSAITTTNVTRVTFGRPGTTVNLTQVAPSQWQATFPFSTGGLTSTGTQNFTLNAYGGGSAIGATIQVPMSVFPAQ